MSTLNPPTQKGTTTGNTVIKLEEPSLDQQLQSIDWDSERQLVSSLAKLQELESKIHELRSLLPDRLLAPLSPIVNPRRTKDGSATTPIPQTPQQLSALLRKSATEGVAEVNSFRQLWLSSDMQAIWKRVDEKLAETKGAFPQAEAGMWQVDYAGLLREMDQEKKGISIEEKKREEGGQQTDIQGDQQQLLLPSGIISSTETDPKTVLESFQSRSIPGFRLARTKNESMILVSLGLAGLTFEVQEVLATGSETTTSEVPASTAASTTTSNNTPTLPEWRVSTRQSPVGKSSRLENAIVHQLNSRPRKWDLRYLLEYILSYASIRSQPCKKCNRLTDSSAQLPILRKPVANNDAAVAWEAYHEKCI